MTALNIWKKMHNYFDHSCTQIIVRNFLHRRDGYRYRHKKTFTQHSHVTSTGKNVIIFQKTWLPNYLSRKKHQHFQKRHDHLNIWKKMRNYFDHSCTQIMVRNFCTGQRDTGIVASTAYRNPKRRAPRLGEAGCRHTILATYKCCKNFWPWSS